MLILKLSFGNDHMLKETPLIKVHGKNNLGSKEFDNLFFGRRFFNGQPINLNPLFGFYQLVEVAVKSLSSGINDPATAILSLHRLTDLLAYYLLYPSPSFVFDEGRICTISSEPSFAELFQRCIAPIWHYGKNDPMIQQALIETVQQLKFIDKEEKQLSLFNKYLHDIRQQIKAGNATEVL